jgi:hypothetical protein
MSDHDDDVIRKILGIPTLDMIRDLTREELVAARKKIQATPADSPLRSLAIRLLAEARKLERVRGNLKRAVAVMGKAREALAGEDAAGAKAALDAVWWEMENSVSPEVVDQCLEDMEAISQLRQTS